MIQHIRVQNFRSLADVTVDLDPLTVLIGRGGTGKSNFVQAIRLLRDGLNARAFPFNAYGGQQQVLHADRPTDPLQFAVAFELPGFGAKFTYWLQFDPTANSYAEFLKAGEETVFHHAKGTWVVRPKVVGLPDNPGSIMLGAIPGIQESTLAHVALRAGIGCYDFPGNVLARSTSRTPDGNSFADDGANYLATADRILSDLTKAQHWRRISKLMRAVNRSATSLTLAVPTPDRLDVGYQVSDRLLTFDVRQESEGFRRFLAHLLALYQTPSKTTLLFEHPESGLHPGALETLFDEFKACPRDGRGQVILTTHSPQLLDYFPPESIRVVDIENQSTRIGPLDAEQAEVIRDHLMRPGDLLTSDEARMAAAGAN